MKYSFFVIFSLSSLFINSCTNSKNLEETPEIKESLSKGIPFGMVDVTIIIGEIYTKENKTFSKAEILQVHEYGNSVRALSEKVNYEFEISEDMQIDFNLKELIGKKSRCRLMKLPGAMDRTAPDKLKIVSIETD